MLDVPLAFLLERSATLGTARGLHADAMDDEGGGQKTGDAKRDRGRLECDAAEPEGLETAQERGIDVDPVADRRAWIAVAAADAGAVSYTPLDVYKRQANQLVALETSV